MGFPKPWPTGWPIELPAPNENDPEDPVKQNPEDDEKPLTRVPEYRSTFRSVTWAVNHACNLRCTHCYDVVPFRRQDLNTEQALAVIDRLSEAGVTFIAFSGGEAFLRKDLFQRYLSTVKLLHVLQTPAEQIRERLSRDRPTYLDVCGRKAWTDRTNTTSVPQRLISVAEILPAVR